MTSLCIIVPSSDYLYNPWTIEPLGALYLATYIKPWVDVVAVRVWDHDVIPPNFDWYGISVVTPHYEQVRHIIDSLRCWYPKSKIVLGGAHCTFLPNKTLVDLKPDFLVAGEGEFALANLLGGNVELSGIYYAGGENNGLAPRPAIAALPIPDHSLLLHSYHPNPAFSDERGGAIMASRGCPYGCSYCGPSVGKHTRWRNPKQVAIEMHRYNQWRFEDDDLFGNHEWFKELAQLVPPSCEWRCSVRAKSVTPEILEIAKSIGCRQVGIGVETASPALLKMHCPSKTVKENTRAVVAVKEAGLMVTAFMIAGLPGETEETLNETITWIKTVKPDKFTVSACTPYPGSKLWAKPGKYGMLNMNTDFSRYQQLGLEDDDVAFVYDTEDVSRQELTKMWHRLRGVAQYGIANRAEA